MGKYTKELLDCILPISWRGGCRRHSGIGSTHKARKTKNIERRINSILDEVFEKDEPKIRKHAKRIIDKNRVRKKGKWNESNWGKLLEDESYRNPSHYNGKSFRRRFRVPYVIFLKICELCREAKDANSVEKLKMQTTHEFRGSTRRYMTAVDKLLCHWKYSYYVVLGF